LQGHTLRHAGEYLSECQLHLRFEILALHRKSTTIAGSPASFEQIFKDVGKAFSAE
jgi:hypothetical protein